MTLGHGRTHLAIPGPSVMPDAVLRAMHRGAPNIYHGELTEMMPGLMADLKRVARTEAHSVIYIANGHGVWEAALANTLSRGDHVLILATGRFAHGWGEMATALGVEVEVLDFGLNAPIDADRVTQRLSAPDAERFKAVLAVQVDTATSVRSDIAALRKAMDAADHPALLMVDCIACLGCDPMEMDAWGCDVVITGSQKGLMTPPGIGFVFYNDKADAARETANCVTHYWDWRSRTDPDYFYRYFDGTAPTHHLYGLRAALDILHGEGLENVWRRHRILAETVWAAFETWTEVGTMSLNVPQRAHRAHSVTGVNVGSDKGTALREWCEERAGLTLGIGLGMEPTDHFFRVGHMGHVSATMVLGALATIEAGMKAVGIEHAPGGMDAAAAVIAENA